MALTGRAAGCSLFLTSGGNVPMIYQNFFNLIGGIFTKLQLIRWKKSFRQIHSPTEEQLQPEPAVPGVVVAEEDPGGAGERWDCYYVLAHIHGQPSSFFQN